MFKKPAADAVQMPPPRTNAASRRLPTAVTCQSVYPRREKHRLVYKGTIVYFQVAPACLALAKGSSPITIVGTNSSGTTETVEVGGPQTHARHLMHSLEHECLQGALAVQP